MTTKLANFQAAVLQVEGDPIRYRCTELWYPDGSLVLQAENIIFRVYSGLLAKHSTIFGDMFLVPQPENQETYEGVPFVRMDDSAEDLRWLLLAEQDTRYDSMVYALRRNIVLSFLLRLHSSFKISSDTDIRNLAGLLRLSSKYMVSHVRKTVIAFLKEVFPSTLEEWDKSIPTRKALDEKQPGWDIILANCAREHDIPIILPAALLKCSLRPWHDIVNGEKQVQGRPYAILNLHNQRDIILAKPELDTLFQTQTYQFLWDSRRTHGCCQKPKQGFCKTTRAYFLGNIIASTKKDGLDIISQSLVEDTLRKMRTRAYCEGCLEADRRLCAKNRQRMWDELPKVFGFAAWKDLRSIRDLSEV